MYWPHEFGRPAGDFGSGRAAWACKTGLGYAVAMRRLCGGYAGGIGPTLPHLSLDQLSLTFA